MYLDEKTAAEMVLQAGRKSVGIQANSRPEGRKGKTLRRKQKSDSKETGKGREKAKGRGDRGPGETLLRK